MATELVLLGTAGAPAPVAGRAGISSALVTGGRVFVVDCGRGTPSGYADAGLGFAQLAGVFITHLHVNHIGDLAGLLLYPWGLRAGPAGPLPPVQVYGPGRPAQLPDGDAAFHRRTTIHPELPAPGTTDLVGHLLAGYAYHLNVMPLDAAMPDPAQLVRATDITAPWCGHRRRGRPGQRGHGDARPRGPGAGLPVRHRGRLGGVLRRHHGGRQADRAGPGGRHPGAPGGRPGLPGTARLVRRRAGPDGRAAHGRHRGRRRGRAGRGAAS